MEDNKCDIYMASLWRDAHCIQTIMSLINQKEFGTLTLICNNYTDAQFDYVSEELGIYAEEMQKVFIYRGDNAKESNEKLKFVGKGKNKYVCFCDDDLIYSPNFLQSLVNGCEKYNAAVGWHGIILDEGLIESYYRNRKVYPALGVVKSDFLVDIVSNCGSLFKREWHNNLDEWYDMVGNVGMDDIYVNYFHKRKGIKRIVLAHNNELRHKIQKKEDNYIFDKYALTGHDEVQTMFINSFWNA